MTDIENIIVSKEVFLDLLRRAEPGAYLAEREQLLIRVIDLRTELAAEQARSARLTDALKLCLDAICQSMPGMPLSAIECKAVGAASTALAAEQEAQP